MRIPRTTRGNRLAAACGVVRMPAAVVAGTAITAGTTYALARHVHTIITHAAVSADPAVWASAARTQAYDPCYNGCNDCDDVNFAYNACALTARALAPGITCDGNAMWNWANRYPDACLQAVGTILQGQALTALKQRDRNQLAIIILTILAGVVGAVATYRVMGCVASRWGASRTTRGQV